MIRNSTLASPPAGIFKAILWKELRENLKWCVVGMLGLAAGLTYELQGAVQRYRFGQFFSGVEIMSIFDATAFGAAIIGLLLGLAQSIPENRGDKWGFLAHRPVSRSTLFRGKVSAGILLYVAATGLPLLAAMLWIASPGHFPFPFGWSLALPGVADLCCGLVFYFAGMLTGMREARWYGSRALGVGASLVCLAIVMDAGSFWQAFAVSAIGIVIVGAAAAGSFNTGGGYSSQPRTTRVALGLSIALGIFVAGVIGVNIIGSFQGSSSALAYWDYTVTSQGDLVKTFTDDNDLVEATDLQGKTLGRYKDSSDLRKLTKGVTVSEYLKLEEPGRNRPYRRTSAVFMRLVGATSYGDRESWYYVPALRLIAGYNNRSGQMIGWIGPDGFSSSGIPPRSFEGDLRSYSDYDETGSLLAFPRIVYRLDTDERRLDKVYDATADETILTVTDNDQNSSTVIEFGEDALTEIIVTTKRLIVQTSQGKPLLDVPHDPNAAGYATLRVTRALLTPDQRIFVAYMPNPSRMKGQLEQISEYRNLAAANHHSLPVLPYTQRIHWVEMAARWAATPLAGRVAIEMATHWFFQSGKLPWNDPGPALFLSWILPVIASLVSAKWTFARGKRFAFAPRQLSYWTTLALLFGPLAFLLMLALIDWPALEACPACGKKRIVTREHCEHCHAPFVPPPMDGTEIFDFGEA